MPTLVSHFAFQRAVADGHPGEWRRKLAVRRYWSLAKYVGVGDTDLGAGSGDGGHDGLADSETADELQAFCAERLADYKRPRAVRFVDELPRNATGKVMKHRLREDAST